MKIIVTFEYDEKELGQNWLNQSNLESLIYSENKSNNNLIKVVGYGEQEGIIDSICGEYCYQCEFKCPELDPENCHRLEDFRESIDSGIFDFIPDNRFREAESERNISK